MDGRVKDDTRQIDILVTTLSEGKNYVFRNTRRGYSCECYTNIM